MGSGALLLRGWRQEWVCSCSVQTQFSSISNTQSGELTDEGAVDMDGYIGVMQVPTSKHSGSPAAVSRQGETRKRKQTPICILISDLRPPGQ